VNQLLKKIKKYGIIYILNEVEKLTKTRRSVQMKETRKA
jgi:hypothetical protein